MTDDRVILTLLGGALDSLPRTAPDRVLAGALASVATTPQRHGARLGPVRALEGRPILRFALFGASAAALLVLAAFLGINLVPRNDGLVPAGSASVPSATQSPSASSTPSPIPTPSASPTASASADFETYFAPDFGIPLEMQLPTTGVTVVRSRPGLVVLVAPPATDGVSALATPDGSIYQYPRNGLLIASTVGTSIDSCPRSMGAVPLRRDATLIEQLEEQGMTVDVTSAGIDGRPSWLVVIQADCLDHIHLGAPTDSSTVVRLTTSSTITYFVEIAGTTVVIQVWGSSPTELEQWRPVAQQIIRSLRFTEKGT